MKKMNKHTPKTKFSPPYKEPRTEKTNKDRSESASNYNPVWQFQQIDLNHPTWGWKCLKGDIVDEVFNKLKNYETMLWKEIHANKDKNHHVSLDKLCKAAQDRLQELKLDDEDTLYRLRLTGTQRVWGVLRGHVFQILWWDPDHTVCPSPKKHT